MMKTSSARNFLLLALLALAALSAGFASFAPGRQTLVLAHNAYPDAGQWTDRLDHALAAGTPLAIEIDLSWVPNPQTGKNISAVGDFPTRKFKDVTGSEPSLKPYFFERVRPIVEKALAANDKKNWPLIRLYLDIKNDPPEHLEYILAVLHEYESWLTTAVKTKDAAQQSPLDLKPLMVMLEDKDNDIKEEYFYTRLAVGGKLVAFGTAKLARPAGDNLTDAQVLQARSAMKPEDLVTEPATNYRRWWGNPWNNVEPGAKDAAGPWTPEKEARLSAIVKHAHKMGYLVSFWVLDGTDAENAKRQGWNAKYNFGSFEAATIRWKAALKAGADFLSTDQYEEVAKILKSSK
jgi:hypothetical protein